MNYKFYIYKQNKPAVTFNKYDLDDYVLIREVVNNSQWGLKIERDKEFYTVIRKKFNGQITLKGEDYNTLIGFERDTDQYAVVITRECSGIWTEFWKGYFSYFDYKVDMDRCYLTFEPQVWDAYTTLFDQLTIERNILAADTGESITMDGFEWPYENQSLSYVLVGGFPFLASYIEDPAHLGEEYFLYSQITTFLYREKIGGVMQNVYQVDINYRREVAYSSVMPPGTYWINVETVSPGYFKWVRRIGDYAPAPPPSFTVTYSGNNRSEILDLPSSTTDIFNGCISLRSVLELFAGNAGLTYTSQFFNDTPCPMGGLTLVRTMIQQISNLRDTADPATKGMMKFKDLLTWIKDTFNAYPYIDSSGDFRIEHKKYFEYGLSYTVQAAITMDLGVLYPDNLLKLRRYEWSKPDLFRYEKLDIPYSYFPDWTDAGIEYEQNSIIGNETITKTVEWATDLVNLKNYKDELPTKGWVLLDVSLQGSGGIFINKVTNTPGAMTGQVFQNARFSPANLFRDLWTWGRLLPEGKVNGVDTTFDSINRLKKQVEISFPQCCDEVDYNGIFRTPLGDGMLDTAEYESKSGNLKVQLIYE